MNTDEEKGTIKEIGRRTDTPLLSMEKIQRQELVSMVCCAQYSVSLDGLMQTILMETSNSTSSLSFFLPLLFLSSWKMERRMRRRISADDFFPTEINFFRGNFIDRGQTRHKVCSKIEY